MIELIWSFMKASKIVLMPAYIFLLCSLINPQSKLKSETTHKLPAIPNQMKNYSLDYDGTCVTLSSNIYFSNPASFLESQKYVVDTAIVLIGADTLRHTYSNDQWGMITLDLTQQFKNEQWINNNRRSYTFNGNHQVLTQQFELWFNNQWINQSRDAYSYDEDGLILSKLTEQWINAQWVNSSLASFTYNTQKLLIRHVVQNWSSGQWVNLSQVIFIYDASGNLTQLVAEQWKNGQWANFNRQTNSYDGNNFLITELFEEWLNSQWTNVTQRTYTYDSTGHLLIEFEEGWIGQWVNQFRRTSTYDERGFLIQQFAEAWDILLGQWRNFFLVTITYDGTGRMLIFFSLEWVNGQWENHFRETRSYDSNGNIAAWHFDAWRISQYGVCYVADSAGNKYSFGGYDLRIAWKLINAQDVDLIPDNVPAGFSLSQNYPNPFNPSTKIQYQVSRNIHVTLNVYDVLGNEVATLVDEYKPAGIYEVEFSPETSIKHPASGVYFYQLKAGEFVQTRKMLFIQ